MIVAVHPDNLDRRCEGHPCVHNQGRLILALKRGGVDRVLLDPALPGSLRPEDLVRVLARDYPGVEVQVMDATWGEKEPGPAGPPVQGEGPPAAVEGPGDKTGGNAREAEAARSTGRGEALAQEAPAPAQARRPWYSLEPAGGWEPHAWAALPAAAAMIPAAGGEGRASVAACSSPPVSPESGAPRPWYSLEPAGAWDPQAWPVASSPAAVGTVDETVDPEAVACAATEAEAPAADDPARSPRFSRELSAEGQAGCWDGLHAPVLELACEPSASATTEGKGLREGSGIEAKAAPGQWEGWVDACAGQAGGGVQEAVVDEWEPNAAGAGSVYLGKAAHGAMESGVAPVDGELWVAAGNTREEEAVQLDTAAGPQEVHVPELDGEGVARLAAAMLAMEEDQGLAWEHMEAAAGETCRATLPVQEVHPEELEEVAATLGAEANRWSPPLAGGGSEDDAVADIARIAAAVRERLPENFHRRRDIRGRAGGILRYALTALVVGAVCAGAVYMIEAQKVTLAATETITAWDCSGAAVALACMTSYGWKRLHQ